MGVDEEKQFSVLAMENDFDPTYKMSHEILRSKIDLLLAENFLLFLELKLAKLKTILALITLFNISVRISTVLYLL